MKRLILILIISLLSFNCYSQKIYLQNSICNSDVIANVKNGYVYLRNSSMNSDLIYYFDGTYIYKLNGSNVYNTSNICLTYKSGKIYKGRSSMYSDIIATWNNNKLYFRNSIMSSDIIFTYIDNKVYNGNSIMHSNIICNTSEYIHPIILLAILSL